jgi:2-polyprenyl-6-methoxyphenol hydroxylase-like FAD-dependent oxidoreductase
MRHAEIAVIGGGLAGSTTAAMLGRAGIPTVLVDTHAVYPPDFRCEKLDGWQVRALEKTGLASAVLQATTPDREVWTARLGRLVEKRPSDQYGILYDALVNTVRAQIPSTVEFIRARATSISTSPDRQTIELSTGEIISARLVVLANGLNAGLRHKLGMLRQDLSVCHSITIGFDVEPLDRPAFPFRAMTYYGESVADRVAYLTLFPVGSAMRANLFVYRNFDDPWLQTFRKAPEKSLSAVMPRLKNLTGEIKVVGAIKIRPADLYITKGYCHPGIVLVGDAFATSCPAAGTGVRKVFTDVERLCNVYIPRWLATPGMSEQKIESFYRDPAKMACDAHSAEKAHYMRAIAVEPGIIWCARRWARFTARLALGFLRRLRERLERQPPAQTSGLVIPDTAGPAT